LRRLIFVLVYGCLVIRRSLLILADPGFAADRELVVGGDWLAGLGSGLSSDREHETQGENAGQQQYNDFLEIHFYDPLYCFMSLSLNALMKAPLLLLNDPGITSLTVRIRWKTYESYGTRAPTAPEVRRCAEDSATLMPPGRGGFI
jgi:hypothetical protein